jgi:ElaB/YqjD/DUF883 family membrane-anchored ribosome-binding protein
LLLIDARTSFGSKERIMAASTEPDVATQLDTIRADIAALTKAVSQLAAQTSGIKTSLGERIGSAAKSAVSEAERIGDEAIHGAAHGAKVAVYDIEAEIARNPLTAVLISLGLGFVLGVVSRP